MSFLAQGSERGPDRIIAEHFYLETMSVLAVPKLESGEMEVYASTQALTDAQRWVSQVTGVPRNRVVARSKRLGGGFGGKETRSSHVRSPPRLWRF